MESPKIQPRPREYRGAKCIRSRSIQDRNQDKESGKKSRRGIKKRRTRGYESVSDESGVGATADPAADGAFAVEPDAAPGAAPAAMALAFLPFSDGAGRGGTFVLSTT
jgi:hypothetical protein